MTMTRWREMTIALLWIFLTTAGAWKWGEWSNISACSVTCGSGSASRVRTEIPEEGDVVTEETKMRTFTQYYLCFPGYCPRDGKWSTWGRWGRCNVACGGGMKKRIRECNSPIPVYGGKDCEGENFEAEECNTVPCPPLPLNFNLTQCAKNHFMCSSGKMCIPLKEQCDKVVQCHDGSDETSCFQVEDRDRIGSVRYRFSRNRNDATHVSTSWLLFNLIVLCSVAILIG